MWKYLPLLAMPLLAGCFMMPMGYMNQSGQMAAKSDEQSIQRLDAQYSPPVLSIKIEGEGHVVTVPEPSGGNIGASEPNKISVGATDRIEAETESSFSVTKRESLLFVIAGLVLLFIFVPKIVTFVKKILLTEWHKII